VKRLKITVWVTVPDEMTEEVAKEIAMHYLSKNNVEVNSVELVPIVKAEGDNV